MTRWPIVVACAALLPGLAAGQYANRPTSDSVSAPIRDVRYDVTFMRSNGQQRVIDVAMSFNTAGTSPVLLSLPAWTPGAYEISNFSRWVVEFAVTGDGNKPLTWDKLDYDTWRIRPAGAKALRVSFRYVADTLDNAMAWAKPDFLLFNGTNLFFYAEGQPLEMPATVAIHTEADWRVATGMSSATQPRTFTATNYHDLVDMPFFVGHFDLDSARVAEKWIRLATYPAGAINAQVRSTAWDQLKRVIPPEATVFGEIPYSPRPTSAANSSHRSTHTRSFTRGM
jgi:predicted metalloprotease with PDZ domain